MGIFHKDLEKQIDAIVISIKRKSLDLPQNWHWIDYKAKAELAYIDEMDTVLIKKLNLLHEQGKEIPALSSRILLLCSELHRYIDLVRQRRNISSLSAEGEKIKAIIRDIDAIYQRELAMMHRESKRLIFSNKIILECKKRIIECLKRPSVDWNLVETLIREMLTTRSVWLDFTKSETNLFNLISKGAKYEQYHLEYKRLLGDLEREIDKTREMAVTKEGSAWYHIETSPGNADKQHYPGLSLKKYETIDLASIWNMLKYLLRLAKELRQLALHTNDSIQIKIPASFLSFVKHPDSVVIHYYNPRNKNEIPRILNGWLHTHGINSTKREYGRAEHARDFFDTSFSDNVAKTITNLMRANYGRLSNESLAISGINYAFGVSKEGI